VNLPSAEILLTLLHGAQMGVGVIDDEGRYLYANERLAEVNGISAEAHIGRTVEEVVPELATVARSLISEALETGRPVVRASVPGGTPVLPEAAWDASYVPVQFGDTRAVALVISDATDRVRAIAETHRRLAQQAALADLGQLALRSSERTAVLEAATGMLVSVLETDFAGVLQLAESGDHLVMCAGTGFPDGAVGTLTAAAGPGSMAGYTLAQRDVVVTSDTMNEQRFTFTQSLVDLGVRSAISAPIPVAGGAFGVLGALSRRPDHFRAADASTLRTATSILGTLVMRTEHEAQVADLAAQRGRLVAEALDTGEREQRQVADLLHDDALQHLLFARMELGSLEADPEAKARVRASLDHAARLIRNIAGGLHPTALSHAGLGAALEALCGEVAQQSGLRTEVAVDQGCEGVADDLVHSIVRELLSNVVKHARAEQVRVAVSAHEDRLAIVVADDGRGMTPAQFDAVLIGETVGLAKVRERVAALGGSVDVGLGLAGRGTAVELTVPR
jgi:PAS domain S-box-containing protein